MPQTPNVGELGEQLVAQWLQTQNWQILYHRWRCRWGEIDLIACYQEQKQESQGKSKPFVKIPQPSHLASSPLLAFVEVKTRSRGNWDAGGRLAITPPKQAKLWQTAELFLAKRPDLASLPCRFDVAIVSCQCLSPDLGRDRLGLPTSAPSKTIQIPSVQLGQPVVLGGYRLTLQEYIQSAFD